MILTNEQFDQLIKLTDPVIKFLNDNCPPHVTVIITTTDAELLEGVAVHYTNEDIKD
jgi:hypothetical protein